MSEKYFSSFTVVTNLTNFEDAHLFLILIIYLYNLIRGLT